jgi:hypothetical protein
MKRSWSAAGLLVAALGCGAALAADAGDYRDPRGRLSIAKTSEWGFRSDGKGGGEIECNFGDCLKLPASVRKNFCAIQVDYAKPGAFNQDSVERVAPPTFATALDVLSKNIGPMTLQGKPERRMLKNGAWMTAGFSGRGRLRGVVYEGRIWISGHDDAGAVILCFFPKPSWPTLESRLEALVASVVWARPAR